MFKVVTFKILYIGYCWAVKCTTVHHIVKDHVFVVLLSCEEKKLSTSHLYVNTRNVFRYTPPLCYFANERNKFIATILTNYNLQITIANYNCSPYRRLLPKDSDRLAYGGLFLLPSNCDSCR